jgi:hypothetical protein
LSKTSAESKAVVEKYGDCAHFAIVFNPDLQVKCGANPKRAFMGSAPPIRLLKEAYSDKGVQTWLMIQIDNLNEFVGVKEKMDGKQTETLAAILLIECADLKASELMLFFYKLKAGVYGSFYGVVDPTVITGALVKFKQFRSAEIHRYREEEKKARQEAEYEEWKKNRVPCPDDLKTAKAFSEGELTKPKVAIKRDKKDGLTYAQVTEKLDQGYTSDQFEKEVVDGQTLWFLKPDSEVN